jgi:hypothetical protein
MAAVGIDAIFEVKGASRAARSYAFLYAAFKRSEVTESPVRDAVDCLVPFIISHLNNISGRQVYFTDTQTLTNTIGTKNSENIAFTLKFLGSLCLCLSARRSTDFFIILFLVLSDIIFIYFWKRPQFILHSAQCATPRFSTLIIRIKYLGGTIVFKLRI